MDSLIIEGGAKLSGSIVIQGAKNGALPVLAATVLGGRSELHNCPCLSDIDNSLEILRMLGCGVERSGGDITVTAAQVARCDIPSELMRKMRSSVIFLGAVAARCGKAVISSPGGCELGPRPIDMHLDALKKLGLDIREEYGMLVCESAGRLRGAEITLPFPSVGATENTLLAASTAKGRTVITGAAREPEVAELAAFLNAMGAQITGAGSDVIVIDGVVELHDAEHTCIPDRIVATTYAAAAMATGSEITLQKVNREHMTAVFSIFEDMGCVFLFEGDSVTVIPPKRVRTVRTVRTMPYPGFPTDAQAIVTAVLATAEGTGVVSETVFGNRFRYTGELVRMGANIKVEGRVAIISGVERLTGAPVECTDLRGGAALAVAALGADGESVLYEPQHIDRGYECIEESLTRLGAKIYRKKNLHEEAGAENGILR